MTSSEPIPAHFPDSTARAPGPRLENVARLLDRLEDHATANKANQRHENRLIEARLGVAASLLAALRMRHCPSASHSLRVALGCSAWGLAMQLPEEVLCDLEVAALLHDIGKVGVPEALLLKPSRLTDDEAATMEHHRRQGTELVRPCAPDSVIEILRYTGAWFNGGRPGFDKRGEELPMASRMVTIVDAFDAMTAEQVYRRALPRDRALAELLEFGGTQFDPRLAADFCQRQSQEMARWQVNVMQRWLHELTTERSSTIWGLSTHQGSSSGESLEHAFHDKMLECMHDAVVFIDASLRILNWNRAAERLFGRSATSLRHMRWSWTDMGLYSAGDVPSFGVDCPVHQAFEAGDPVTRNSILAARTDSHVSLELQVIPVRSVAGAIHGAAIILHDTSPERRLEEHVQTLHEKATRDPLTQVANRAEFDRALEEFVPQHLARNEPCSLIICDLDFFKRINDSYGHQAGDEALISFAGLLRQHHRKGDVVARYGGEEFVLLCAECNLVTAAERAEQIRRALEAMPQPALSGKHITASFGVTEVQSGDSSESMLRRADRALLEAKELGRNVVVQIGVGLSGASQTTARRGWFDWFRAAPVESVLQRSLSTPVPIGLVVEKLKGFVSDHHAEIVSIDENHLTLCLDGANGTQARRTTDRPIAFVVELRFESAARPEAAGGATAGGTLIDVTIRPKRSRDRRLRSMMDRARMAFASLRSYLIATEIPSAGRIEPPAEERQGVISRAAQLLGL